jgi:hypothetical protein
MKTAALQSNTVKKKIEGHAQLAQEIIIQVKKICNKCGVKLCMFHLTTSKGYDIRVPTQPPKKYFVDK